MGYILPIDRSQPIQYVNRDHLLVRSNNVISPVLNIQASKNQLKQQESSGKRNGISQKEKDTKNIIGMTGKGHFIDVLI